MKERQERGKRGETKGRERERQERETRERDRETERQRQRERDLKWNDKCADGS
jgi:hypothetical protein